MPKLTKEELAPYESKLSQMAAMLKFMDTAPIVSITVLNPGDAKTDPLQFNCTMTGPHIIDAKRVVRVELEKQMEIIRDFISNSSGRRKPGSKKPAAKAAPAKKPASRKKLH